MILFGGATAAGVSDDTWSWDGATWTLLAPQTRPPAREDAAMTLGPGFQPVLFGGHDGGELGDTWRWTGTDSAAGDHARRWWL